MGEHLVFVYGSLVKGECNHHHLRDARFIGEGITQPYFELVDLGAYPAMVLGSKTAIHGEVYEVDDELLARLDRIEGHPHFYVRSHITLQDDTEVWVYLMRQEIVGARPRIASGNWRRRSRMDSWSMSLGMNLEAPES